MSTKSSSSESGTRNDLRGAAAFALGLICAGLACSALYLWSHLDLYQNDLPPLTPQGHVHTINFYPWAASGASGVTGAAALWLWWRSMAAARAARRPWLTLLHVGTPPTLLPLLFLVLHAVAKALWHARG